MPFCKKPQVVTGNKDMEAGGVEQGRRECKSRSRLAVVRDKGQAWSDHEPNVASGLIRTENTTVAACGSHSSRRNRSLGYSALPGSREHLTAMPLATATSSAIPPVSLSVSCYLLCPAPTTVRVCRWLPSVRRGRLLGSVSPLLIGFTLSLARSRPGVVARREGQDGEWTATDRRLRLVLFQILLRTWGTLDRSLTQSKSACACEIGGQYCRSRRSVRESEICVCLLLSSCVCVSSHM